MVRWEKMQPDWNTIISVFAALSPFLLAILGGISWLYRREKGRREAVERQLSERKYNAYITLLDILFGILKDIKAGNKDQILDQDLTNRMIDASKDLLIYGSDDVVNTYNELLKSAREGKATLRPFGEIVISIRQDMGNKKTKITSEHVLRQFILDYEDAKAKGLI